MELHSTFRRSLLSAMALVAALALVSPAFSPVFSQGQLRTVHGVVVDKDDNPASSSTVYLMNAKTQAVKTSFTDDAGKYHFSGLDPNVDYQIHAERGDMVSPNHTISNFDSRRDIDVTLKLSHTKGS